MSKTINVEIGIFFLGKELKIVMLFFSIVIIVKLAASDFFVFLNVKMLDPLKKPCSSITLTDYSKPKEGN